MSADNIEIVLVLTLNGDDGMFLLGTLWPAGWLWAGTRAWARLCGNGSRLGDDGGNTK